jgi:hypothetical protein
MVSEALFFVFVCTEELGPEHFSSRNNITCYNLVCICTHSVYLGVYQNAMYLEKTKCVII